MSALIQQSKEWHELRKSKIGSSDAPVIMNGEHFGKTPFILWKEKLLPEVCSSFHYGMQRGLELEDKARQLFIHMTGISVIPQVAFHSQFDWMMASLDGIDSDKKNIVELKCAGKEDHEIALNGKIPEKYFSQVQHQLEVCQIEKAYYFSFDGEKGVIVEVYRDEKYIAKMLTKEKEFFQCMEDLVAPALSEKDYIEMEDDHWKNLAGQWLSLNQQMKDLKTKEDEIRKNIISLCMDKNCKGSGIKVTTYPTKGAIQYANIPELIGVNLEQYRKKPVQCWRFTGE